jgi:hypothetical protein
MGLGLAASLPGGAEATQQPTTGQGDIFVFTEPSPMGALVHMNDWNQYTVIARGGTFLHILNGQLMAVMIDDDPASSNNQPGMFGIEIEATTKVSVRNMWVKKLN